MIKYYIMDAIAVEPLTLTRPRMRFQKPPTSQTESILQRPRFTKPIEQKSRPRSIARQSSSDRRPSIFSARQQLAAVSADAGTVALDQPSIFNLPDINSPLSRRQFLRLSALGIGAGAATMWGLNRLNASSPPVVPPAAIEPPRSLPIPPQAPIISGPAKAGVPEAAPIIDKTALNTREFTIINPGRNIAPSVMSNYLPYEMLNPLSLSEARLNSIQAEPFVRNSLRLVQTGDPANDRSLIDFIEDNFDDPAHGYYQSGKLLKYPPPKELRDGTKEYTILDENGPTLVNWMWFTNKNYKDNYGAMGNIRIYTDDKLVVNMPAADYFRAQKLPQLQGFNWTFNQAKATGSYYPLYGAKSLRICFTKKPQWFDIRGIRLKEPIPGYQTSFTQPSTAEEMKNATRMLNLRDQPEKYIDMIDGVERKQGIVINPQNHGIFEFKNQFANGASIDSFHLTLDAKQLQSLRNIRVFVDDEKTIGIPIVDFFHVSFDDNNKLTDHKAVLAGVTKNDDGTVELYLNCPFSYKKGVRFEIENVGISEITIQGRFKTTNKYIPAKLYASSQEGAKVDLKGKGKLLRLDWDINSPRKYKLSDGQESDTDEFYDQNPTTILDGVEEKSTGAEDFTGHGFYWALWSTHSALPGGMVFSKEDALKRHTRFYRQFFSDFEGGFNKSAVLELPIPQGIKDKAIIRSSLLYYKYDSPVSEVAPKVESARSFEPFYFGAHGGIMYLLTNKAGYPIGVNKKIIEDYAKKFALANPQVETAKKDIPMSFNIDSSFIRADLLSELLIVCKENNIRPRLVLQTSIQETLGIDQASENRGKTIAEDIQNAINVMKKIDPNYPQLKIEITNEPNFTYEDPLWGKGWTGTGSAENGGKSVYMACQHFLKKCPGAQIGLPALVIYAKHPNVLNAAHTYAREFFEEVAQNGLPKNVTEICINAFGFDPLSGLIDVPFEANIWYDEANNLGLGPDKIPPDIFITEMGPGDKADGTGNEYEKTVPYLTELAEIMTQCKEKKGDVYTNIVKSQDENFIQFAKILPKIKGVTFFTWNHSGDDMTFHPEIKFRLK